jgi:hypothetical protein
MTSDLHRLVYYSKNRIPGDDAELAASVAAILAASQANNALVQITGALIFNSGVFAQVLEGSLIEVENTFERIQRDARHGDVQVLAFDKAASRGFPSWSMGFVGNSRKDEMVFGDVGKNSGFEAKRLEGERIFEIMHQIALEEEQRAA